jgi:ribosomal protein L24
MGMLVDSDKVLQCPLAHRKVCKKNNRIVCFGINLRNNLPPRQDHYKQGVVVQNKREIGLKSIMCVKGAAGKRGTKFAKAPELKIFRAIHLFLFL